MTLPPLPVYLIHYDQPEWCASATASVKGSQGVQPRLTVVDNGERRSPGRLESLLPGGTRLLRTGKNLGFSGGANRALDDWLANRGEGELCVIGSHDLHLEPNALRVMVDAAHSNPGFGILGPGIQGPLAASGGVWEGSTARLLPPESAPGVVERDWVSGTCLLLRYECVRRVGRFDERFGSYVEDVDYCLRARDAGFKVGTVGRASAWGLGSASGLAAALTEANSIRLVFKRSGTIAGARALGGLFEWVGRSAVGAVLPGRPAARRAESLRFLRQHLGALRRLLPRAGSR
jgi:GT2 family glycosyltransferase